MINIKELKSYDKQDQDKKLITKKARKAKFRLLGLLG
jgi:hypothetical protein